jgi:queuine tRNA-ribosyltransferase
MGLGTDAELLAMVALGIDMFDCVLPTRLARTGTALTSGGRLSLRQSRYREDLQTLEPGCPCPSCSGGYTRAYLRHLFQASEILAHRLLSLHNLTHLGTLMEEARQAIAAGAFVVFRAGVLDGLAGGVDSERGRRSPVGYSSRP